MNAVVVQRSLLVSALVLIGLLLPAQASGEERGFVISRPTLEVMKAEKRIALVIGNGAYKHGRLKNPTNDARDMAAKLKGLGFELVGGKGHTDLTREQMLKLILDFSSQLNTGGVGLFYFAGHGVQHEGRNYLLPLGSALDHVDHLEIEAVDVAQVLERMETAKNRLNIVILDACRNNPLGSSLRSPTRGLAKSDVPRGTLIAFAAAPGKAARDGQGGNGTFTAAFLSHMAEPGLELEQMLKRVRRDVREKTSGAQTPWHASSLEGDFVFALPAKAPARSPQPTTASPLVTPRAMLQFKGPFPSFDAAYADALGDDDKQCMSSVSIKDADKYIDDGLNFISAESATKAKQAWSAARQADGRGRLHNVGVLCDPGRGYQLAYVPVFITESGQAWALPPFASWWFTRNAEYFTFDTQPTQQPKGTWGLSFKHERISVPYQDCMESGGDCESLFEESSKVLFVKLVDGSPKARVVTTSRRSQWEHIITEKKRSASHRWAVTAEPTGLRIDGKLWLW